MIHRLIAEPCVPFGAVSAMTPSISGYIPLTSIAFNATKATVSQKFPKNPKIKILNSTKMRAYKVIRYGLILMNLF